MKRILAIDYGLKNIGIAFTESLIAEPVGTIKSLSEQDTLKKILTLVDQYMPELIVIGIPEGPLANSVKNFASDLQRETNLPIVLHPETLSTKEAITKLRKIKATRVKLRNDHVYAACLILDDYLESIKSV